MVKRREFVRVLRELIQDTSDAMPPVAVCSDDRAWLQGGRGGAGRGGAGRGEHAGGEGSPPDRSTTAVRYAGNSISLKTTWDRYHVHSCPRARSTCVCPILSAKQLHHQRTTTNATLPATSVGEPYAIPLLPPPATQRPRKHRCVMAQ